KLSELGLFAAKQLNQAHSGYVLREKAIDPADQVLDMHEIAAQGPFDEQGDDDDQRRRDERNQSQLPVNDEHHDHDADQHQDILEQIDQDIGKKLIERFHIIGRAGDQPARRIMVEKSHRQQHDMQKNVSADMH